MREEVYAEQVKCFSCKHLFSAGSPFTNHACSAFPFGVPDAILYGYVTHTKVITEQNGNFVYEKREENT